MHTTKLQTSVVVVGGSLVGLSAALFLSWHGVPVVLIERHLASLSHPRAIGYTARTVEFWRNVGILSRLPEARFSNGRPRRILVESLTGKWQNEQAWTKQPGDSAEPKTPGGEREKPDIKEYSPVQGVATAQDKIEPLLRGRSTELGADLRLGFQVTSWHQDDNGIVVTAASKDGCELQVSGAYMIACDGGKSSIREQLGIERHGVGHLRSLRSILFRCPQLEEYFHKGYSQFQIEDGKGFEAFMTSYGEGRLAMMWSESGEEHMDEATQKSWIRKAAGKDIPDEAISLITTGQWETGGYIADSFSKGRVFLAGDAAHMLPPNRGGYGANTGIADAYDIAWKLSAVIKGVSRPALLETYDAERRPVAQLRHDQIFVRNDYSRFVKDRDWDGKNTPELDDVAMEFGQVYRSHSVVGAVEKGPGAKRPEEWRGQPGIRAPHVALDKSGARISTLDLFGSSWVVLSQDASWAERVSHAAVAAGVPCLFVQIGEDVTEACEGQFVAEYGVSETGAVLVRPDGHIAWRITAKPVDAASQIEEALAQASCSAKAA